MPKKTFSKTKVVKDSKGKKHTLKFRKTVDDKAAYEKYKNNFKKRNPNGKIDFNVVKNPKERGGISRRVFVKKGEPVKKTKITKKQMAISIQKGLKRNGIESKIIGTEIEINTNDVKAAQKYINSLPSTKPKR